MYIVAGRPACMELLDDEIFMRKAAHDTIVASLVIYDFQTPSPSESLSLGTFAQICSLTKLNRLVLKGCCLASLEAVPPEISQLTCLRVISCSLFCSQVRLAMPAHKE